MKNSSTKLLSLFLALVTALSCFAMIPAAAETTQTTEPVAPQSNEKVLWELDFDDLAGKNAVDLRTALIDKGLYIVPGEGNNTSNPSNKVAVTSDGLLHLNSAIISGVPYQYFVTRGYVTAEAEVPEAGDTFYNLFYGLLTTDGKAMADDYSNQLKEYYFDFDYKTNGVSAHSIALDNGKTTDDDIIGYYKKVETTPTTDGKAGTKTTTEDFIYELAESEAVGTTTVVTGKDSDSDTTYTTTVTTITRARLTYQLTFLHTRGESIFTTMATNKPYEYLMKVTPNGWLYAPSSGTASAGISLEENAHTVSGTYSKANFGHLTVNKFVHELADDLTTVGSALFSMSDVAMTTELYDEIVEAYNHTRNGNMPATYEWNQGNLYVPDAPGAMLIEKQLTNMRIAFSVNGKSITAKIYTKPANELSDGAWTYVGYRTYTYGAPAVGTSKACVRFNESKGVSYFDNFKLWTVAENAQCSDGNHVFDANVIDPHLVTCDGVYGALSTCLYCGNTVTREDKVNMPLHYDFTNMTADEFASAGGFVSRGAAAINAEKGGLYVNSSEFKIKSPITDATAVSYVEMTVNFDQFPTNQNANPTGMGSSFFTFQSTSTDYSRIFMRVGRKNNSDPNSDGWIKLYQPRRQNDWVRINDAVELKRGVDYKLTLMLVPANGIYHLYVDGVYKATGFINGGIPARTEGSTADYPAFRVCNAMNIKATFKDFSVYSIDNAKSYSKITPFAQANENFTFEVDYYPTLKYDKKEGLYVGNSNYQYSEFKLRNDNILLKPFNLTFDFKIDDMGYFDDDRSAETQFWSLVTAAYTSSDGKFSTASKLRVGGVDLRSDDDNVFDKTFFVNSTGSYTTLTSEDNGYQSTKDNTESPYYSDASAIYDLTPDEWVTVSITADPYTRYLLMYVNNELVASSKTDGIPYSSTSTNRYIRLGDAFRKLLFNWDVKDIKLEFTENPLENTASGMIYYNNFVDDSDIGGNGTADRRFGHIYNQGGITAAVVSDTNSNQFVHYYGGSNWRGNAHLNFYATSIRPDGSYYQVLEGDKYAVTLDFALNNRLFKEGEPKGSESFLYTSSTDSAVLRWSKYHDNNKLSLIGCNLSTGLYTLKNSTRIYLYNASGYSLNAWTTAEETFDDEGNLLTSAPAKWTKLTVVIDESNNTATFYVNGRLAYYGTEPENGRIDPSKLTPAVNVPFNVTTGTNSKFPSGSKDNWDGKYASLPYFDGTSDFSNVSNGTPMNYIRILQNTLDAYVREFSVDRVSVNDVSYSDDYTKTYYNFDPEIEFIGTQTRNLSESNVNFDMRFVFGADSVYTDKIRYKVTATVNDGEFGTQKIFDNDAVYGVLKSDAADINAAKFTEGSYLTYVAISEIPYMVRDSYTIKIMPEYVTANKVTGGEVTTALTGYEITVSGTGEVTAWKTVAVD